MAGQHRSVGVALGRAGAVGFGLGIERITAVGDALRAPALALGRPGALGVALGRSGTVGLGFGVALTDQLVYRPVPAAAGPAASGPGVADGSAVLGKRAEPDFEAFARASMHRLLRTAVFLVDDRHIAEDLVQVSLERTARHWRRIGHDNPEAYARKVLVNLAIDRSRKLRRGRDTPIGDATDLDLLGSGRDALAPPGDADASGDLAAGLAALPARQRAVVVLRYWCDLDEREIAHTLGISVGSVKTHASRALKALHGRLTSTSEVPR